MDKFSELKRRANKCPIKRFKAFIGKANTQATLCADTGIEIIGWSGFDASDLNAKSHRVELARFIAAADPETVLALLAELEFEKQNNAGVAGMVEDYETKLAAKDKLIAELSRLLAHNIERAEAAEAKMATPVRLPNKNDDEFWFDNVFQVAKFDRAVERAIRAAGFTVEGVE